MKKNLAIVLCFLPTLFWMHRGTILIVVKDNGEIIGADKIDETLRKVSDIITNGIESNPQDDITSELKFEDGKTIIAINITKGIFFIVKNGYLEKIGSKRNGKWIILK